MKLSNLKIGTRIYLGFGVVVVILMLLLLTSYGSFTKLKRGGDLNIHTYQVVLVVERMRINLLKIQAGQRGYALAAYDDMLDFFNASKTDFEKNVAEFKQLTTDNPAQQERAQKILVMEQEWVKTIAEPIIAMRKKIAQGGETMDNLVVFVQTGPGKKGMNEIFDLLDQAGKVELALVEERSKDVLDLQRNSDHIIIFGGLATILIAALTAWWLMRNITLPLREAVAVAQTVASGDLTSSIDTSRRDETGVLLQALKTMNDNLLNIVSDVRSSTDTIAEASGEIATGNLDLSSRTEQQAASLEETVASIGDLTNTVKQNADNARQANQLAASASEVAV